MKKMTKILALAMVMFAFAANTFAQVTASATATATILTPIAITKDVDMNFGNLAVDATGGTVILLPAGTRSATSGVTFLPTNVGTVTAASFTVTGLADATYSIIIPTTDYIITETVGNSATMIVNAFTSTPTVVAGGVLTLGTQTLTVGATLNVGPSQLAGVYTNATGFDVTVNYN